jgi:hypothetical protein
MWFGPYVDGFWNVRGEGVWMDMVTDWEVGCGDQFGAILRRFENQG